MKRIIRTPVWILGLLLLTAAAQANVKLPRVIGSHMVLQRDQAAPLWGWADPGEAVAVQLGDQPAVKATTDPAGKWRVDLPQMSAGGPYTLTITGANQIVLEDVLIGEVWLCSGQSNMEMRVASCDNAAADIAAANDPLIRHFTVPKNPQSVPQEDVSGGEWQVCSPEVVGGWTACGYFMARTLRPALNVPIGLINTSWGGTRIEPWIPPEGFAAVPELAALSQQVQLADARTPAYQERLGAYLTELDTWVAKARASLAGGTLLEPSPAYPAELVPPATKASPQQQPTTLYNGMVHGLLPYAARGAIWYQGESNHGEGILYTHKMRALIEGWRQVFGLPDLAFNYVQIAPYRYGTEPGNVLAEFWEAQAAALAVPGTGLVVTNDIGNYEDIHPKNKQEVGRRLALLALAHSYGQNVVCDGPVCREFKQEGETLRLSFDHVGGGLVSRDGQPLTGFEIIGPESDFTAAEATIDGETIVLSSPKVKAPQAVRFAWDKHAEPNLANRDGLPARPFRAGEVPVRDFLKLRVPEAAGYQLVYDLDLGKLGLNPTYDVDSRDRVAGPFDRIAYFLELKKPGEETQYVYVSMDAFTDDVGKIGIPSLASGAVFQTKVANVNVISNVTGIVTGEGLAGCNLEFWPHNYGGQNSINIPNASQSVWDFGDGYSDPRDGYGSMQVHNYEAKQTLFAINSWKRGRDADLGIGNSSLDPRTRDWTFAGNGGQYEVKRLRVLVRLK